jgi:hypothetical protein
LPPVRSLLSLVTASAAGLVHVGIDLLGGHDVGVPKDDLRVAGRNLKVLKE